MACAERVPVVEDLAQRGLLEVLGHDLGLDRDGPLDELAHGRTVGPRRRLGVGLDEVEDHRVGDEPALDDLGQPGHEVVGRQRLQRRQVAQHPCRRVERADEVLALGGVDAGLAADRRVDHAEQRRGQVDDLDPAQPGRRDEAGQVGDGAPTDPDDGVAAGEAGLAQHAPQERRHLAPTWPPRRRAPPRRTPRTPVRQGRPGQPRRWRAGPEGAPPARARHPRRAGRAARRAGPCR